MNHTPGPWSLIRWTGFPPENHWPGEVIAKNGVRVYAGPSSFHALRGATDEEAEANARLIAAAPDLLAAAQDILGAGYQDIVESAINRETEEFAALQRAVNQAVRT